jgi:hypothetical protein
MKTYTEQEYQALLKKVEYAEAKAAKAEAALRLAEQKITNYHKSGKLEGATAAEQKLLKSAEADVVRTAAFVRHIEQADACLEQLEARLYDFAESGYFEGEEYIEPLMQILRKMSYADLKQILRKYDLDYMYYASDESFRPGAQRSINIKEIYEEISSQYND